MRMFAFLMSISILGLCACNERYRRYFPPKPTVENRIFDNAHLFTNQQKDSIFKLIKELDDSIGSQIAVLTIETLNGQEINQFSLKKADSLNLGRFNYSDGLLFTLSVRDRMMRMEIGRGLEKIIPDDLSSRINRLVIAPKFRMQKYGLGIYAGIDTVKKLIETNRSLIGVYKKE